VVVSTEPRAGAADVPASTTEIRVTFSRPMRNGDWSWVKLSDASFPKIAGNPRFLEDQRTCVLAVSLEPGKTYAIWLNQPPHENFQDPQGHNAVPYLLVFETKR
jgi:RNA polymerase sigma-70 factor (ECF subfamily)